LKLGDSYTRKATAKGTVVQDPSPEFLAKVPRNFRDTLPSRMDRFREREIKPKEGADFGYADVELWMKAEAPIRRPLMPRFRTKALKDPTFKSAIVANMSSHPEWDPILFPEKYLPKDPPPGQPPAAGSSPTASPTPAQPTSTAPTNTNPTPGK